jgi:hypothetical protein
MSDCAPSWGRAVLDPTRGHVRETRDAVPSTTANPTDDQIGLALCGALLVADHDGRGDFPQCSICLKILTDRAKTPEPPQ